MLLGGYNGCPGVSNLQAFQQIEEYAVLKFPERFQLNGNRFSVEFDLRARNECDIFVRFDLEPTQLDSFLGSTLLKTRTALSSTAKPDAFGKYQERTAWPIGRVASYLAGDARSPIYAGERTQSLLIDIDDPTRYVVYVIVNVVGFSS
jgi:hypothetical protein